MMGSEKEKPTIYWGPSDGDVKKLDGKLKEIRWKA